VSLKDLDIPDDGYDVTKKSNLMLKNWHFLGCNFRLACFNRSNTCCKFCKCSSKDLPIIIMSSRYTRQLVHYNPVSTESIRSWKVAGALQSPKGITLNSRGLLKCRKLFSCNSQEPLPLTGRHSSGLMLRTKPTLLVYQEYHPLLGGGTHPSGLLRLLSCSQHKMGWTIFLLH